MEVLWFLVRVHLLSFTASICEKSVHCLSLSGLNIKPHKLCKKPFTQNYISSGSINLSFYLTDTKLTMFKQRTPSLKTKKMTDDSSNQVKTVDLKLRVSFFCITCKLFGTCLKTDGRLFALKMVVKIWKQQKNNTSKERKK